ncbi:MAG: hypothetical protein JO302_02840 [Candidatus Eremiobacteraeota bacterium]|nr:hypothetical protein [Candidatus Eremiobacteraeota bacterium]
MAVNLSPINTQPGEVVGTPDKFHPHQGDSKAGGRGNKVNGIACDPIEYVNDYHVHADLVLIYKNQLVAVPTAIGMQHPGPKQNGYVTTAGCFYFLHTHDSSGYVHVETPKNVPLTKAIHPWGDFFDIWGVKLASDGLGPLKGTVHAFLGNVAQIPGQQTVSSYTAISVDSVRPTKIRSHQVLVLAIDSPHVTASKLMPVTFYSEY